MKVHYRLFIAALAIILIFGTVTVQAASPSELSAKAPWTKIIVTNQNSNVIYLSTASVGKYQIPFISNTRLGANNIHYSHRTTSAVPGNCGPDNSWHCTIFYVPDLNPSSISQMATINYINSHAIRWAYGTDTGMIRGASLELKDDMTYVGETFEELIKISKFGNVLIGAPSIQIIGGHYHLAATIRSGINIPTYKLIYMHYIGNFANDSCQTGGFAYQCDVIDESSYINSMGPPSLSIAQNGSVGIAYYKNHAVNYAYPHEPVTGWPSNCGPGSNTWRCISVFPESATGDLGNVIELASGASVSQSGIVFTYDDTMIPVTLYHADYVGAGGNCGTDYVPGGAITNKWDCEDIVNFNYLTPGASPSYSIDIDPGGYSVIAYDYRASDLGNKDLFVTYPKARIGSPDPGWIAQKIDSAPVLGVDTGSQAALALNESGYGFIGYLREIIEPGAIPDMKAAYQWLPTYLPVITKH